MTEKQENILSAALKLFAEEGFSATSTSKVAKAASVSEGLIFRHFGNKEGLLNALLDLGQEKAKLVYSNVIFETDPKELIRKAIQLPFNVAKEDHDFWRLQFKLKWELNKYNEASWEPLQVAMTNAFKKLKYKNPEMEAEYIKHFLDGLVGAILRGSPIDDIKMTNFLLDKYQL